MGVSFSKESDIKMDSFNSEESQNQDQSNSSSMRPLSIEGPSTSNDVSLQPVPDQPRQPTNLQGLLTYCMSATQDTENMENKSQVYPLDEQKKIFLNEALSSLTVNVIEELQKAVHILSNVPNLRVDDDVSDYENALEGIADFVDGVDIANDFYKIGGFSVFKPCLNSSYSSIRWRIADIIAELAQNNPFCQEKILEEAQVFPTLLHITDTDPSEQARIKALYAVSCIVRGHAASLKYLAANDGYSILLRAMQSPVEKLQIKSAFLLSSMCSKDDSNDVKNILTTMGFIEQTAVLLSRADLQPTVREQLLRALSAMTRDNLPALVECRRPELCLKSILEQLLAELNPEENQDEIDICTELLDTVFFEHNSNQER